MARQDNRSISGRPTIFNLGQERCCGKADGKCSVVFWLDKVKVDDEGGSLAVAAPYFLENITAKLNIRSRGTDIESPCRVIFASGVDHSRLINGPVG